MSKVNNSTNCSRHKTTGNLDLQISGVNTRTKSVCSLKRSPKPSLKPQRDRPIWRQNYVISCWWANTTFWQIS